MFLSMILTIMTMPLLVILPLAITFSLPLPIVIQAVIAIFLPLIVGLVTTRMTPSSKKAILLVALSLITSGFTEFGDSLATGSDFDLGLWLFTALGSFVVSVGIHYGVWKSTGATEAAQQSLRTDSGEGV